MPIILLQMRDIEASQTDRPSACPLCGSKVVLRWGQAPRRIYDTKPINAVVNRYLCESCKHTFRYYPQGFDRSPHSIRIRRLAALIWLMDMSCRDVVEILNELGVSFNRMTIWREGQKLVKYLALKNVLSLSNRWSIEKFDGLESQLKGGTFLAVSLEPDRCVVIGALITSNPQLVISWLHTILKDVDIEVSLLETQELPKTSKVFFNKEEKDSP